MTHPETPVNVKASPSTCIFTVEVMDREAGREGAAVSLVRDMHDLGIAGVEGLKIIHVYRVEGALKAEEVERLARLVLADPITQTFEMMAGQEHRHGAGRSVEVAFNPGVMDPREESIRKAAADLGVTLTGVRTALRYEISGDVSEEELRLAAERLLLNKTVQHAVMPGEAVRPPAQPYTFRLAHVNLADASDEELERLSRDGQLWLTLDEMRAIRDYFAEIGRNPTDIELETLAQTWSEHCVHKTLKGDIRWHGGVIHNLLKSTIAKVTEELSPDWCLSVFQDNAGVIAFDDEYAVCFKVETHNHPSALEPYGGAATGLGGVIRDTLGTGLSARPILNTDVFCFGPPDLPYDRLPKGTLHPRRVFKGVRAGVADYGNRMGIPTGNGAV
ncbi:MAG: phosphoribosylformylglycinamidine synthase subunit PurS, partial [Armatimonadota bacterium]|nr:phosphoribosylformylglycinamidine synthase subunit PurS [Armatimonadota bacterium]